MSARLICWLLHVPDSPNQQFIRSPETAFLTLPLRSIVEHGLTQLRHVQPHSVGGSVGGSN